MRTASSAVARPGPPAAACHRRGAARRPRTAAAAAAAARGGPDGGQASLLALTQWALGVGIKYAPGLRPTELGKGAALGGGGACRAAAPLAAARARTIAPPPRDPRCPAPRHPLPPGSRGVVTSFPVAAGAALVSVPARLALSSGGPPPPGVPAAAWAAPGCPWYAQLAVKLLIERAAGPASPLAPFIAALPPSAAAVGLPAAWCADEVAQLQAPQITRQVGGARALGQSGGGSGGLQ
jgi:hypothetical protein